MRFLVVSLLTLFVSGRAAYAEAKASVARDAQILDLHRRAEHAAKSGEYSELRSLTAQEANLFLASGRGADAGELNVQLGELNQVQGIFTASEVAYKKGIELLTRYAPSDDMRRVVAMDDLGWLYLTWGRALDGARLMEEARIRADKAKPTDPTLVRHLDIQAAFLMVTGKYSDAQKHWTRALAIGKAVYGPDSPKYDDVFVHYGQGSALWGDYKTAEEMFKRYLSIEGDSILTTPTARAVAIGELARVYTQERRYDDAEQSFTTAIQLVNKKPDEAPLVRSMILSYFGDYYMARQDWSAAQTQYREVLRIQQSVLGENRAVASSMISLSNALGKLHLKKEAHDLMTQAKAILASRKNVADNATVDIMSLRRE